MSPQARVSCHSDLGWKSQPVVHAAGAFFPLASTLHSVPVAHTRSEFMWLSHLHICWVFFFCVLISALFAFIEGKWNLAKVLDPFLLPYTPFGLPAQVEG